MAMPISARLERALHDHPNRRFYSPDLQTFIDGKWKISIPGKTKITDELPYSTVERFGQSGWDYQHNVAKFLTLDFDHDDGHDNNSHSAEALQQVADFLTTLPYVDLNRSTGGKGFHARVQAEDYPCKSTDEYQALRRRMLLFLDSLDGVKVSNYYDPVGRGILWLWRASR